MSDHHIIQGDVLDGLRTLPDACIQCTVTSPPYYGLRNYGVDGQIGLEETPEAFVQKLVEVFREVRRVLRDDGTLWLNLGDSYSGSGKGPTGKNGLQNAEQRQGSDKSDSNRGSLKINALGGNVPEGYKAKDMMGMPWKVAFALQAVGWYLRSDIIWFKPNPMPESVTDRPTKSHEYIFLLTKSPRYFYDAEAIREPSSESYQNDSRPVGVLRQKVNKRSKYPDAGQFKKQDLTGNPTYTGFNERYKNRKQYDSSQAGGGSNCVGHSGNLNGCDGTTRNARTVWTITTQARPEAHFATFPDELAETCIKAGTSEYGCCPKCGAPWKRIVEASGGTIGESWTDHSDDLTNGKIAGFRTPDYKREFKGWQPGCKCNAGAPVPCVVLDPFMGSGTVAVVARNLNRSSVGCELNPAYVKIIKKRLDAGSQLDTGAVLYRFDTIPMTTKAAEPGAAGKKEKKAVEEEAAA